MVLAEYPSIENAHKFYEQAKAEFSSDDVFVKKNGCEKAYRAATEMVDAFLVLKLIFVPAGDPLAHVKRNEALEDLCIDPKIRDISQRYSEIKDKLHGTCFYTSSDPRRFKILFSSAKQFLIDIEGITK